MQINTGQIRTVSRYREREKIDSEIISIKEPLSFIYQEVAPRLYCRENMIEIMQELNKYEPVKGDRFAFYVGIAYTKERVTREIFFSLLSHTETFWCGEAHTRSPEGQLCNMIGRFIISKLADYFIQNQNLFNNSEKKEIVGRMARFVIHPSLKESNIYKALVQLGAGNIDYVINKTIETLVTGVSLRDEIINMNLQMESAQISLREGFELVVVRDKSGLEKIATLIVGNPEKSAKVSYLDTPFGYINPTELHSTYGDSLVASVSGGFRNNNLRPTDFSSVNGEVHNYLISGKEALVMFYPSGIMEIKEVKALKNQRGEKIYPSDKLEDFAEFIRQIKEEKISVMQTFLLIKDGELKIHNNSSNVASKRRLLAEMHDGKFAIVNFEQKMTLLESAVLAKKMGVNSAVALDTGQYDFGNFIDSDGEKHQLVLKNSSTASYVVFYA